MKLQFYIGPKNQEFGSWEFIKDGQMISNLTQEIKSCAKLLKLAFYKKEQRN